MSKLWPPLSLPEVTGITILVAVTVASYEMNYFNYLLFHSTVEIFNAVIFFSAAVIAVISWRRIENSYLLLIGVAFLFIPCVDLVHVLAYNGMGVFANESNTPTSLWILARYLQASAFLAAPLVHKRKWSLRLATAVFAVITVTGMASILVWNVFPITYIDGYGLTHFKVYSEYVISAMLLVSFILLHRIRGEFKPVTYDLLAGSIILSIFSEIAFTSYIGVYDFANLAGHLLKLVVAYLIFKALVKDGIEDPFNTIFHDYQVSQERLKGQANELEEKTKRLDAANEELTASNEELQSSQNELAEYADRLQEMVEERTREVHAAEEKVRQSYTAAAIGRMGATIAHDLRTPLNVISQAAEGLDKFPESRERLVAMIRSNSERALSMIEDIRNATKDIDVRAVRADLASIIRDSIADANPPPTVTVSVDVGQGLNPVLIDPHLIRRVLDNLIRNSIEAMPGGGALAVRISRSPDEVSVSIADTGVGMSEEVAKRVFEPFYTTKANGTGLGLPFCKRAVEAHGGSLRFETSLNAGSTFTMILPISDRVG